MKTQYLFTFSKLVGALFMLFASYQSGSAQSSFNLNDPNVVYKDKDGNFIAKDSVMIFVSKGNFRMTKKDLGNGQIEITLIRETKRDEEERIRVDTELISKWMDKPLPNFNLSDLNGNSISNKDLTGNVTVINFWFTGCGPCIKEMPDLNRLVSSYDGQLIKFLAFSFNDKGTIEKFIEKHKFLYTQIPSSQDLIKKLGIDTYPTHIILDKTGVIRGIEIGVSNNNMSERLKPLIEMAKEK